MTRAPRPTTAALAVLVVLAGLGGRALLPPAVGGPLGDALYATLVVLLVALLAPRTRPLVAGVVGLVVCGAVEAAWLTDLPAQVVERFPAARYVLGTAFTPGDLAWYAAGAVLGALLLAAVRPRARGVDLSLRHVRAAAGPRRRGARVAVPVGLVVVLVGAGGALAWVLRSETQDLSARLVVAQDALDGSADRVADPDVRADLAATIDDAHALLDATPVLDRLPGDAPALGTRLDDDVAAVQSARLAFARAQAGESRDALGPLTRRAEQVLAATDELAADGRGAGKEARAAAREALGTADDLVAASAHERLGDADLAQAEAVAADLAAQRATLDDATTALMTAQDAAVCPEPDQVWFPQAGKIAATKLAPIPWAPRYSVRADVLDGLVALDAAYRAEFGQHLTVNSAYRSYDQQVAVYNPDDPNPLAAPPGCSNHGLGTAVDISMGPEGFDGARYAWLKEHAEEHGWTHPGWAEPDGRLPEPWHWQSVETPTEY
ncbi:M15 family metallopeptidase [Isoptericola sp. F-RaC21]|uniref:M15 family metallopeptidase n=1 Tax=Isoptericola sp. F-RaC21 TaxID=3141452 RepID=UPI00315BE8DE